MKKGLLHFCHLISGSTIAVFVDNSLAVTYLRKQGGTHSPILNSIAQWVLRWSEELLIVLASQFIMGKNNVFGRFSVPTQSDPGVGVDSQAGSVSGSTEEVAGDVRPVCHLSKSLLFTIFFALP